MIVNNFQNWSGVLNCPRSAFFKGSEQDTMFDRTTKAVFSPSAEALFTQSNARVLLGHAANGMLRFLALPTQLYPAPTQTGEFGLGPGMYHHFDVVMYAGNLSYRIVLDEGHTIDIAQYELSCDTVYANHFIPVTNMQDKDLSITSLSFAPVADDSFHAPLAPAPLPGPPGMFYVLVLKNDGSTALSGRVEIVAEDLLLGHYEDAAPMARKQNKPECYVRQQTLILTRPEGSVGIHFHNGQWENIHTPFLASKTFSIEPGQESSFETHIVIGANYNDIMPAIYALHMRSALDWLKLTNQYWRERIGHIEVSAGEGDIGEFTRDLYIRSLFDNFNCLQTDAEGNLIAHWQGAPSHGYGTVWGIDVEPTAVSLVHLCPEMTRQVMLFFLQRSRAPKGPPDHSIPILVAPIIIARQWLQVSDDVDYLTKHPFIIHELKGILHELIRLKAPKVTLFPSRYSSDGAVGRRYDFGTNAKVYYAFRSMAYILERLGCQAEAVEYHQIATEIQDAIYETMVAEGPFGPQLTGGTNLGEDPEEFFLTEGVFYYDGEDTSSMLAPIYGICDYSDAPWGNYHRYARSLWCPNYDVEFGVLLWAPNEPAIVDGTAFFSRLGGSVSRDEMLESLRILRDNAVDEVTGSVFWWPHGHEYKRALTRCSQGQGAWAWQYLEQWMGLKVDVRSKTLIFSPRGLLQRINWEGFRSGDFSFDIFWEETEAFSLVNIKNNNAILWNIKIGFRPYGTGAEGAIDWETHQVAAYDICKAKKKLKTDDVITTGIHQAQMVSLTTNAFGDQGLVFKRYGPAQLWGHWDHHKLWDHLAMPFALRFALYNGTGENWYDVSVTLFCPAEWRAQARRPLYWDPADNLQTGKVVLQIGDLANMTSTVAPFWITAPDTIQAFVVWWNESIGPFHQTSQPGTGITLYTNNPHSVTTVNFTAELNAILSEGKSVRKELDVPVSVVLQSESV